MKRGKGELGKTKKYSGLASTVKQSSPKQIQEPLPRLSLDRIKRLYDEYGFAQPDGTKVQEMMSNDEQKVRKTLDIHRKVMDEEMKARADKKMSDIKYHTDLYKQNQKNHLSMMKAQAKMSKQMGAPMPMNGMGGPGFTPASPMQMPQMPQSQPMQQAQPQEGEEQLPLGMAENQQPLDITNAGEAFFVGEFALVKLVNPGVQSDKSPIWLVDVKNKVLRPFMSQKSFDSYFGASQEAYDAIVVLPSSAVSEGGPLGDFQMLNSEFGVKEDGSMRKLDHSPAMIKRRYGKPVDEASENRSVLALDGLFKKLKSQPAQATGMHQMPDGAMMSDAEMPQDATGGAGYDGVGGPGIPTLTVNRSLEPGMTGEDVKSLQDWLKAQGYLNIANTTTYYGDLTKNAVAAWQKANGIDAGQYPGYFGPRSLAKAQSLAPTGQQNTTSQALPTQSTPNSTWYLSNWSSTGDQWVQQPILTIDGKDYKFNTPQEYITAMQGLPNPNGNLQTFIGQFQGAVSNWKAPTTPQTPTTPTTTPAAPSGIVDKINSATTLKDILAIYGYSYNTKDSWFRSSVANTYAAITGREPYEYTGNPEQEKALLDGVKSYLIKNNGSLVGGTPLLDPKRFSTTSGSSTTPTTVNTPGIGDPDGSTSGSVGGTSTGLPYNRVTENGLPVSGQAAWTQLNAGLNTAGATTTISSSQIEKVKRDPALLAFYINALTYGGYTLGEVFKDIKRRELIDSGKKEYEDKLVISGEKTREDWAQTDEGRLANTLPEFAAMKPGLNNIDPSIFNLPLFDIPGDAFKQLIPILDPTTPEFKAEIEKIQSVMHDIQVATINAKTEQEKAAADYEYEKFKELINKTYGVSLSNNANEAWKQIETLGTSMAQAGISGSGIEAEATDDILKQTRRKDSLQRDEKLTKEEAKEASYYTQYGTPEEIKKLIAEDQAKGLPRDQWRVVRWGMTPSQDSLNAFDLTALKQKYPDKTDEELKRLRDGVIDQYGNYRSDLYQRKWNSLETERVTDTSAKTSEYIEKQKAAEAKAYREFSAADNPYIRPKGSTGVPDSAATVIPSLTTIQENKTLPNQQRTYAPNEQLPDSVAKPIQDAIAGIQKSISGIQAPSTKVATTPTFGDARTSSAPTTSTPKTQYNTLYDYYSKNGGYNSWNSTKRMADAKAAGITNYVGDQKQNEQLLKYLRGY